MAPFVVVSFLFLGSTILARAPLGWLFWQRYRLPRFP
jgi:hypothetical protein